MEWKTKVTEMLGCKYPIIQGAYGGFGTSAIAAPVSAAGGLGIITASALRTPERLREDIHRAREMTDQPFGVNLSLGICPHIDEMREVAIAERVPVIFTSVYNAEQHGRRIKEAGLVWIHKVAAMKHALAAERHGADAVVIVGIEGTGEKGAQQVTTLINITNAVRRLHVPVIAAGGIGDARGFLAALAMGAEAVYMGTAFMATKECPISAAYKQALLEGDPFDPKLRERTFRPPNPERDARLRRGESSVPRNWEVPLAEDATELRMAGGSMAVGVLDKLVSVKELIDGIIHGAEEILAGDSPLGRVARS